MAKNDLFKKIHEAALEQGWAVVRTKKGHWQFRSPDGSSMVLIGGTISDHRGLLNEVARLRRAGLSFPTSGGGDGKK